jgi:hypothetical protein
MLRENSFLFPHPNHVKECVAVAHSVKDAAMTHWWNLTEIYLLHCQRVFRGVFHRRLC